MNGEGIERIAELVRHPGGQQQDRRGLFVLNQPLRGLLLPRDIGKNDGEPARLLPGFVHEFLHARIAVEVGLDVGLGGGALDVEPDNPRLRIRQFDLARNDRRRRPARQQRSERQVQSRHQPPERRARQLLLPKPDQLRGGGVGVLNRAVDADDQNALVNGVEDRLEQPAFPRQALDQVRKVDRVQRVEPPEHAIEGAVFSSGHEVDGPSPLVRTNYQCEASLLYTNRILRPAARPAFPGPPPATLVACTGHPESESRPCRKRARARSVLRRLGEGGWRRGNRPQAGFLHDAPNGSVSQSLTRVHCAPR